MSDLFGWPWQSDCCGRCGASIRAHVFGRCADGEKPASRKPFTRSSTRPGPFAGTERTLGEVRVERSRDASKWAPRDVLVQLLREIDRGEIQMSALVVTYAVTYPDGGLGHGYRNATPDTLTALGLLARTLHKLQE